MKIRFHPDDETGRVLYQSSVDDSDTGGVYGPALISGECYITDGTVIPVPPRPGLTHTFNWATKQWEDQRTLQDLKDSKWETIKSARDYHETGTFTWNGHLVDADKDRITGAATGVLIAQAAGQPFADVWTLADNSTIPVSGPDVLSMGVTLMQHVSSCHAHARALRDLINSSTTKEQVEQITWETEI